MGYRMAANFTEPVDNTDIPRDSRQDSAWQTIVGLFEDNIDTRNALSSLRKNDVPGEAVSIVVRDRKADESSPAERHGAVARAVHANDLDQHAGWLEKLASLIVPERGTYLVAGPIGAALAGMHVEANGPSTAASTIVEILTLLGFAPEEAGYIDSRLLSGALLVGVMTADTEAQDRTRQVFAAESAVHIGRAFTAPAIAIAAGDLLAAPPEASSDGDVVVMDAVARYFRLCEAGRADDPRSALCGQPVLDPDGSDAGTISDYIAETLRDADGHERDEVRYVVLAFGGVLGIGKRYTVLPLDQIDLETSPLRIKVTRDVLHRAPLYDQVAPFSRREEHAVCAYFGTTPFWSAE
jgi:hypothetical protein